jgi:EmrB/QacA subfamily drug resistance transporter
VIATVSSARRTVQSDERYRWYALGTIMLGTVMGPLDGSIANVAMPSIARAFHRNVDITEWVLLSYMLVLASTLVVFGRLGDIFGHKRIYLIGFVVFGLGSLACAFSPTLMALIAFRVFQAVGAAMLTTCAAAIIVESFPQAERGRAIGFNGAAVAAGLSTGPILGGAIVTFADWRWIFLINVPISLVALALAAFIIKPGNTKLERLDVVGAACSIVGLFSLSLVLSRGHIWGWASPLAMGLFVISMAALGAFILVEKRVTSPTFDLSLFSNRPFFTATVAAFIFFTASSGIVFLVPLSAQLGLGRTAFAAGLLLAPLTVLNVVLSPFAGALSDRIPVRYVATAGALVVAAGTFALSRLPSRPSVSELIAALVVTGIGAAFFGQPNSSAIMGSAPANRRGVASATLSTARTTGQLLGVATAGAVYFTQVAALGGRNQTFEQATWYFGIVAALMAAVAAISWTR